eukprot:14344253-Alexandrium_andersonii.AAC.1
MRARERRDCALRPRARRARRETPPWRSRSAGRTRRSERPAPWDAGRGTAPVLEPASSDAQST